MKPSDLAILIPTRNRPAILKRTLEELLARGFGGHQLLVYDDASDEPEEIAKVVALWPGSCLLRGKTRCGQARGRNELMRSATCPYALFLDDDSWPEEYAALMTALTAFESEGVAVATFQYRSLGDGKLSCPPERQAGPAATFLAGACLFHVSGVLGSGGYREFFVYGYEEPELAMRLWLHDLKVAYYPGVVVAHNHLEKPGENRDYREYDFLYARNAVLMSSFNMPVWFGLLHGLFRSLRRSLYQRRNFWPKLSGTVAALWLTFRLWSKRTPCSFSKALKWCRFSKTYS